MKPLSIDTNYPCDVTVIPNKFFDVFMPRANGEFVKIYFYLLRMTGSSASPSLGEIADSLNYTEQDVLRAFRYWEKEGLLRMTCDEKGNLTGLCLINLCSGIPEAKSPEKDGTSPQAAVTEVLEPVSDIPADYAERRISTARVSELSGSEDIREMLFAIQSYLNKKLSPNEIQRLLYFYDELHFSTDLIAFLVEYCNDKDHKSMHYIDKVALNWYNDGIKTVRDARKAISSYRKDYFDIFRALGITGRNPIEPEIEIMKKWIDSYGMSMEVITEACTKTVFNTKKPNLKYTDSIIENWHKKGIRTGEELARHLSESANASSSSEKKTQKSSRAVNKFNNFEQRKTDYNELEKKLTGI